MNARCFLWGSLGVVAVLLALFVAWFFSLPETPAALALPSVPAVETQAMQAALQAPKRERPLIAILAINDATETTDYLMSYGTLKRADVADVRALATQPGPVTLFPALKIQPEATVAQFDERYPDGADYVIVPAMSRDDDPQALQWIRQQAAKGSIIISVCAGAKVVAAAGMLDGKAATTHWYYLDELREQHPEVRYVKDRRIVIDQGVASTTGITASMPMMLTLIEAIAGKDKAMAVAKDLGVSTWSASHDSDAFTFTRSFAWTAIRNRLAFWKKEKLGIPLQPGIDEVSLALVADAWSRTYRSNALTYTDDGRPIKTQSGLRLIPDRTATIWPDERRISEAVRLKPVEALGETLAHIAERYGDDTADFVAMQLEYPERRAKDASP